MFSQSTMQCLFRNVLATLGCGLILASAWLLAGGCILNSAKLAEQKAGATSNCIVARADYNVPPEWKAPVFMGRDFWNILSHKRAPKWADDKKYQAHINTEPMVSESAVRYGVDLGSTNDPLAVGVDMGARGLDKLRPETNVPFLVGCANTRPPLRLMMPFRPDYAAYKKWKEQYPNFIGFEAGDEFDGDFTGTLWKKPENIADGLRKQLKAKGFSEKDIAGCIQAATNVVQDSKEGRREIIANLFKCFDASRGYFFGDSAKMLFLHAGWGWDHYPLEWGAGSITLETTNTGPYRHQIAMYFTRGATRQYRKFWSWYIAVCYNGHNESDGTGDYNAFPYCLTTNPAAITSDPPGHVRGPTCGMSISLNRRDMYVAFLNGASFVEFETWPYAYCQPGKEFVAGSQEREVELSPYGQSMKEWFDYTRRHPDRGVAYAPVALVLPFDHGQPQWGGSPFSHFPEMRWDTMIDAFTYTLVPFNQNTKKGQEGCLANSPYGDIYDFLVLDPPSGPVNLKILDDYKTVVLLGKYNFDRKSIDRLKDYVSAGGTLVINIEQVNELFGEKFVGLARSGKKAEVAGTISNKLNGAKIAINEPYDYESVEMRGARIIWEDASGAALAAVNRYGKGNVLTTMVDWMVPRGIEGKDGIRGEPSGWLNTLWGGRKMPFVEALMDSIVDEALPLSVKGDIEYGMNKRKDGWLVYLINNKGVTKFTRTADKLDAQATAKVTVACGKIGKVAKVTELRSDKEVAYDHAKRQFEVNVGPGDIQIMFIATEAE